MFMQGTLCTIAAEGSWVSVKGSDVVASKTHGGTVQNLLFGTGVTQNLGQAMAEGSILGTHSDTAERAESQQSLCHNPTMVEPLAYIKVPSPCKWNGQAICFIVVKNKSYLFHLFSIIARGNTLTHSHVKNPCCMNL